jgi:glycosyltransferase involved in cell wall biosynthesis
MSFRVGVEATSLLGDRSGVGTYTALLLQTMLRTATPAWQFHLYSNRAIDTPDTGLGRAVAADGHLAHSRWLWVHLRLAALARRDRCDVLHCPNGMGPPWSATPIVLTIHDLSLFRYPQYHPRARILTTRGLLPRLARRAAAVVAVSEFTRREILSVLHLPPEKVHTIHSAAAERFHPVTDPAQLAAVRQRYTLPERFVLFVGTVEPRKNLQRLVRAFRQVRQRDFPHALILAGHSGWLMDDFDAEIEHLGLSNVARRLGYVADADLPALYSLAELFVYPSLYEGFGLPTLEAMACGTPVLSSNSSALAEVCGDAACLVDPLDEDALADAMASLLRDDERRAELRHKGLGRARQFSWQRTASETMAVYERACRTEKGE